MAAKTLAELEKAIMKEIVSAMRETEYMAMGDMNEGIDVFYGGGTPVMYKRTGQLRSTPKTSGVEVEGKSASFKAYLDQSGGYTTGKQPSMATVLQLANYGNVSGYRPTVGAKGFWEYSEKLIEESLNKAFSSRFG